MYFAEQAFHRRFVGTIKDGQDRLRRYGSTCERFLGHYLESTQKLKTLAVKKRNAEVSESNIFAGLRENLRASEPLEKFLVRLFNSKQK